MKKRKQNNLLLHLIMIILALCCIVPLLIVVGVSLSSEADISKYGYRLIPKKIDFGAYKYVFNNPRTILNAYKVTIFSTFVGTCISVLLMSMIAYPLSKKYFKGKKFVSTYVFITMIFSGGLVPTYLLNTKFLHLGDTLWIYILPSLINVWHVFMIRTFMSQLPDSIFEAARIDGSNELYNYFIMALPMCKPVLATVALLGALTRWNDWNTALLYINKEELVSLQYLLQRILLDIQLLQEEGSNLESLGIQLHEIPSESARMAMAVIAAGPMLFVFPFFQKYFVHGLTVGAVKG